MTLTLSDVATQPKLATYTLTLSSGEEVVLRPLEPSDFNELTTFLQGLSSKTRTLSKFDSYDTATAKEFCDAINKYDKLRFVIEPVSNPATSGRIVGLLELSLSMTANDMERFNKAGYQLNSELDCRFGPTLSDDYQNRGLGSKAFPLIRKVAQQFGKKRMILWGGVRKDNVRAIHFYEKHGFKCAGEFIKNASNNLDMILELN